jgi:hypothetical protein
VRLALARDYLPVCLLLLLRYDDRSDLSPVDWNLEAAARERDIFGYSLSQFTDILKLNFIPYALVEVNGHLSAIKVA